MRSELVAAAQLMRNQQGVASAAWVLADLQLTPAAVAAIRAHMHAELIDERFRLHLILALSGDAVAEGIALADPPRFFELQIRTLFQHAWSEANHDLGYKPDTPLCSDQTRQLAFTAAQAWGADHIFNELHRKQALSPEG